MRILVYRRKKIFLINNEVAYFFLTIKALIKKFPEITSDMLYALLRLRGDISSGDYKEVSGWIGRWGAGSGQLVSFLSDV